MSASGAIITRDRKPSVSATSHFITQGLTVHTVSTPDETTSNSSGGGGLGSYFSLSRTPSVSKPPLSRRASLSNSATSPSNAPSNAGDTYHHHTPTSAPAPPSSSSSSSSSTLASQPAGSFSLKHSLPRAPGASQKMFVRNGLPPQVPPNSVVGGGVPVGLNGVSTGGGGNSIGPQSPHALFTAVHDTCTKRIATLDYLRRAHEGRVYFFNVMLTPRTDLAKVIYPDTKKLQKKAINFFTLGNSLPSILEVGGPPLEYLKAFNHLLHEYETHISLPPSRQPTTRGHSSSISAGGGGSGSSGSSANSALRNMSLPKFFSRATHSSKPRRGSSAAGGGAATPDLMPSSLERTRSASNSSDPMSSSGDMLPPLPLNLPPPPPAAPSLLPSFGDEYLYLTTPVLPFEPDYFETFATLCDVLIDVYSRVLGLVNTPQACVAGVGEAFLKADSKIRRLVVGGTLREWEDAVRSGVKREITGLGREVLGGIL